MHIINYTYNTPVKQSINQCILRPIHDVDQQCLKHTNKIEPNEFVYDYLDYWGNTVETFYMKEPHHDLRITTQSLVSVNRKFPDGQLQLDMNDWDKLSQQYAEFLKKTSFTDLPDSVLKDLTDPIWDSSIDAFDYVNKVNTYIYEMFEYESGSTNVETTAQAFFNHKKGVCQDFTHLMLCMCRYKGIPARYVSGYVYCGQDSALRGDAAMHAWIEVMLPGMGWVGLDPTNRIYALDQHIRVAVGRDYLDIVPVKGVYIGGDQTMTVNVSVSQIVDYVPEPLDGQ